MKPTIQLHENETEFWTEALKLTLNTIHSALEKQGEARIGLAGGSTPKKLYEMLSSETLPWEKITWILVDERCVPPENDESNLKMLRQAFFLPAKIPPETQIFFDTRQPADEALKEVIGKLQVLEESRTTLFDLLILGAGRDGHIASLFEGDPNLHTNELAYQTKAPKNYPTTERFTLSLSALTSAEHCLLLLKGKEKKPLIDACMGESALAITALRTLTEKVPTEVLMLPNS